MEDAALTPLQVARHASLWPRGEWHVAPDEPTPEALYRFAERSGNAIHDESAGGNALLVPHRYFNPRPRFLVPVWESFRSPWEGAWTWSYWSDVIINICGFVPFGFLLAGWLSIARPNWYTFATSVGIGFAVSLTIESTQYFLPTRDSSMTDLLTNTLGTILGVVLFSLPLIQAWLSKRITSCAPV
jgi:VanZ like family